MKSPVLIVWLDRENFGVTAAILDSLLFRTVNFNFTAIAIFSGAYTAMMDFAPALFPCHLLAKVQSKRKERLISAFSLTLGAL